MMPQEGTYHIQRITRREFGTRIIAAARDGKLKSWIGYQQNADFIYELTGIKIEVTREVTKLKHEDKILVIKLKYRATGYKGEAVDPKDFEFYLCRYETYLF